MTNKQAEVNDKNSMSSLTPVTKTYTTGMWNSLRWAEEALLLANLLHPRVKRIVAARQIDQRVSNFC